MTLKSLDISNLSPSLRLLYDKYKYEFNPCFSIDEKTWILLGYIIHKYKVKSILEFGSGLSTILFDRLGVNVTAYETDASYVNKTKLDNSRIVVKEYNEISEAFDMAFIDGPIVTQRRHPIRLSTEMRIPIIALHDTERSYIKSMIGLYLGDYDMIGKLCDSELSHTKVFELRDIPKVGIS